MGVVAAVSEAFTARLQAETDTAEGLRRLVETVHAATRALKVHYVELLVQEGVKACRSVLQSGQSTLEHLIGHVLDCVFLSRDLEEFFELVVRFSIWVEVHLV